jgi:hypothetical protein
VEPGNVSTALLGAGFVMSASGCYGFLPGCPGSHLVVPVLEEHRAVVAWIERKYSEFPSVGRRAA